LTTKRILFFFLNPNDLFVKIAKNEYQ